MSGCDVKEHVSFSKHLQPTTASLSIASARASSERRDSRLCERIVRVRLTILKTTQRNRFRREETRHVRSTVFSGTWLIHQRLDLILRALLSGALAMLRIQAQGG
jgi:hypothetical protein